MDWFTRLFLEHGSAQAISVLSLAVVFGLALGRIRICGISLGVGGVLFSGLILAHFGINIDPQTLLFVRGFGLTLFVFTVGMQVGPGFVDSLRRRGLFLNLAAALIVLLGTLGAAFCFFFFDLPVSATVGLLSGAVTNTPSLAAASQVFTEIMPGAAGDSVAMAGMAYAITYPLGTLGIILVLLLVRTIFRINPQIELEELKRLDAIQHPPLQAKTFIVTNPNLYGMSLRTFFEHYPSGVVLSRVREPNSDIVHSATFDTVLLENMLVHAVGQESQLEKLRVLLGPVCTSPLADEKGPLVIRRLLVTKSRVAGKSVRNLGLTPESGVTVTRIIRAGVEFAAGPGVHLHYGDKLVCVGDEKAMARAGELLGNSDKALAHPHLMPIFLGILFGVIFGSLPIAVPGLPSGIRLGLAGGPLLAAILLSRINHFAGLVWYLPVGANLILREIGIALFLACVGLNAGAGFVQTLLSKSGALWLGCGACITFFPLLAVALLVRIRLKYDYASICGLLSGSMTNTPALAFSVQMLNSDAPSSVYATLYPLTLILRILAAQVLVLVLYYFT